MKEKNIPLTVSEKTEISLAVVSEEIINSIITKQDRILELISGMKPPGTK